MHPTSTLPDSSYSGFTPTYIHQSMSALLCLSLIQMSAIHEAQQPSVTRYLLLIRLRKREAGFLPVASAEVGCASGDTAGF